MKGKTRKIILYASLISFFALAVPVLMYAAGYVFDWKEKELVATGGFYLTSSPKKAEVFINGKKEAKTPALIKRLLPKEYQIEISKEGFHSWKKSLKIESSLVTEARDIFLVPQEPTFALVKNNLTPNFSLNEFINPQEKNIFYIQQPSKIIYKTDQARSFNNQVSLVPVPGEGPFQIIANAEERIALLSETGEFYLLNEKGDLFQLISPKVKKARFSSDCRKILFFTDNEIWVYYLKNAFSQPQKTKGEQEFITRLGSKIKDAIWYGETNSHIVFSVDDYLKFIELDGRDHRNIVDIIKIKIEEMAYHQEEEKIYLLKEGRQLLSLEL